MEVPQRDVTGGEQGIDVDGSLPLDEGCLEASGLGENKCVVGLEIAMCRLCFDCTPVGPDSALVTVEECETCERPMLIDAGWMWGRIFCCGRCRRTAANARARERRRLGRIRLCEQCGEWFQGSRRDARFCSGACRQAAYRERHRAA
jgi:hypothetical protein